MINFLSIITSSLKSLVSNTDVPKPSLYLEYKSKNINNMILTDGNYDFEAENISYTSPKKSYFPSQNEKKTFHFAEWHLEFRLKKQTHQPDLWLFGDTTYLIDENENKGGLKIRVDLLSDSKILLNKEFGEELASLKNLMIKNEYDNQIQNNKKDRISFFIPQKEKKIGILDYFGTPFLNEKELKQGVGVVVKDVPKPNYKEFINYNVKLETNNNDENQKIKKGKFRKQVKISKNTKKIMKETVKSKEFSFCFDLNTIISWKNQSQK